MASDDFLVGPYLEMAARRHRVIVFDRPGYGWSDRPRGGTVLGPRRQARLFHAALRAIGIDHPVVHGHSWGALVAMAMGLDFPQSVRGLVLESGYFYPSARPDVPPAALQAVPVLGDVMRHTISPLLFRAEWPALARLLFAPQPVPDFFWRYPHAMSARPSQLRAASAEGTQIVPAAAALSRHYDRLAVPAAILAGSGDPIVWPKRQSARLAAALPQADYRLLEDVGHMIHHSRPDAVLEAVEAVAGRTQATRTGSEGRSL